MVFREDIQKLKQSYANAKTLEEWDKAHAKHKEISSQLLNGQIIYGPNILQTLRELHAAKMESHSRITEVAKENKYFSDFDY